MYHSITFSNIANTESKNTWDDWRLIPKIRPVFAPPEMKTHYVELPGGDGIIDLSTLLTDRPTFNNREGNIEFYVDTDYKPWYEIYSEITNYLHGQKVRAALEDEPNYYYEGRFTIDEWASEEQRSIIKFAYNVYPYKFSTRSSMDDWVWDTFNFNTDIAASYGSIRVDGSVALTILGSNMPVIPTINASDSGMSIVYSGTEYTLEKGSNRLGSIVISGGQNEVTLKGNGTISIDFRWGKL